MVHRLRDHRVKAIRRLADDARLLRAGPRSQQAPETRLFAHGFRIFARLKLEFETVVIPESAHQRGRAPGIANLAGDIRESGRGPITQQEIDDQPVLIESQVLQCDSQRFANDARCPVTADEIVGFDDCAVVKSHPNGVKLHSETARYPTEDESRAAGDRSSP